jgi:hypothetical protein
MSATELLLAFMVHCFELSSGCICCVCILVDQGSFAPPHPARSIERAAFAGKTRHDLTKRRSLDEVRTFFMSNPTWE